MQADTIVAVSSPPGRSRRGLVRLSGPDAPRIVKTLTDADLPPPRTLHARRLKAGGLAVPQPDLPCLLAFFPAPHSFTGEDVVEIQLPGNAALLLRVVRAAVDSGARLAEPGEFTFRAFTAGKLDLTQAEGVAATISATSEGQLRAATMLRHGDLGAWASDLVDTLATQLALTEAGIDFVDQEDVVPITPGNLDAALALLEHRLNDLLSRCRSWGELEALPWVVLVGAPSAGKSTLFNALLGQDRAVVDAQPGTTRDVIREPLVIDGKELMLVDIAGLDDPLNLLDEQVQALARDAIDRADLIVNVLDPTRGDESRHEGLNVYTKADLGTPNAPPTEVGGRLRVSAASGEGISALRSAIAERLADRAVTVGGEAMALQPRHEAGIRCALEQLGEARKLLEPQRNSRAIAHVELVAGCLRSGLDELASLGGKMTPDDVIGRVFATFCVGK